MNQHTRMHAPLPFIDVAAQKVIKTIQVGELPWGVTISRQ